MKTVGMVLPAKLEKVICPVCSKEYAGEATLKKHLEKEHPDYVPEGNAHAEH